MGEEIRLCRWFVTKPCYVILVGVLLIVLCLALTVVGKLAENDEPHNREYFDWSHEFVYEFDQSLLAIETLKS